MPTCSLSSYLTVSAKSGVTLFRQIVTMFRRIETLPIVPMFKGLSGKTWETVKIAHERHNDVRRLCWHASTIFVLLAELGLRKPPSGNPEGLALLGEGCAFPLPLWSSSHRESGETGKGAGGVCPVWRVGRFCPPYSGYPRSVAYI